MKLALFGGTGEIGSRLLAEARDRGHQVTAVVRGLRAGLAFPEDVKTVVGDATDAESVAGAVTGHDAVISAVGGVGDGRPQAVVQAAHGLIDGLARAGVTRLLVVGGAGSLLTSSGEQLVDTRSFPEAWKPGSEAQRDALAVYRDRGAGLEWSYLSPADEIQPGARTGRFRLGRDELIVDAAGKSAISIEDYAVAMLDELERDEFIRARFTVGYA